MPWLLYLAAAPPGTPPQSAGLDPAWIVAAMTLATAVTGLMAWFARSAWRILRQVSHFLDEWKGEAAHDGLPARPGVMVRLGSVEETLARVLAETKPNHGHSLRDVIGRIESDIAGIKDHQAALRGRIELFETQRAGREENR